MRNAYFFFAFELGTGCRAVSDLLKICLVVMLAAALLGCHVAQRSPETGPSARFAASALEALAGCQAFTHPAPFESASSVPDAARTPLTVNKVVGARLQELSAIKFALDPKKPEQRPGQRGGLIAFAAPAAGVYVLGSASVAWIDLVEAAPNRVATPRSYEWVELCGRRMKAGIFDLQADARYVIQLWASPDAIVDLFVSGPLN